MVFPTGCIVAMVTWYIKRPQQWLLLVWYQYYRIILQRVLALIHQSDRRSWKQLSATLICFFNGSVHFYRKMCLSVSSMPAKIGSHTFFVKKFDFLRILRNVFFRYHACVMKLVVKNSNSLCGKYAASHSQYGRWMPRAIFIHYKRYWY